MLPTNAQTHFLHVDIRISIFGVCRCFHIIILIFDDVVAFVGNEDFKRFRFVCCIFLSFTMSFFDFEANREKALEASMAKPAAAHRVASSNCAAGLIVCWCITFCCACAHMCKHKHAVVYNRSQKHRHRWLRIYTSVV